MKKKVSKASLYHCNVKKYNELLLEDLMGGVKKSHPFTQYRGNKKKNEW